MEMPVNFLRQRNNSAYTHPTCCKQQANSPSLGLPHMSQMLQDLVSSPQISQKKKSDAYCTDRALTPLLLAALLCLREHSIKKST